MRAWLAALLSAGLLLAAPAGAAQQANRGALRVTVGALMHRSLQLLDTGAQTIASGCPFCMTMLKDGVKAHNKEDEVKNLDVVEMLAIACGVGEPGRSADAAAAE